MARNIEGLQERFAAHREGERSADRIRRDAELEKAGESYGFQRLRQMVAPLARLALAVLLLLAVASDQNRRADQFAMIGDTVARFTVSP